MKSPQRVTIRFKGDEYQRLEEDRGTLSISAYVRKKLFGDTAAFRKRQYTKKQHRPNIDAQMIAQLLGTFGQSELATSISRWSGVKPKQIEERLGDIDKLPSVAETRAMIAKDILSKIQGFQHDTDTAQKQKERETEEQRKKLEAQQQARKEQQTTELKARQEQENQLRQARLRRRLLGLLDRLTGKRKHTLQYNEQEQQQTLLRDKQEKVDLQAKQQQEQDQLHQKRLEKKRQFEQQAHELKNDAEYFQHMKDPDFEDRKKEFMKKRKTQKETQNRIRGPTFDTEI